MKSSELKSPLVILFAKGSSLNETSTKGGVLDLGTRMRTVTNEMLCINWKFVRVSSTLVYVNSCAVKTKTTAIQKPIEIVQRRQ